MATLFSQNGWVASENRTEIDIKNYEVAGTDRHLACSSKVAPILCAFASEFDSLIEPIDEGIFDDWGYAYRDVRAKAGTLSNHSSGTAIDLNASKYPLGTTNFPKNKIPILHNLVIKYGLRWGGDYKSRKDEMHYEITQSPEQVKARIVSMKLKMPKEHK